MATHARREDKSEAVSIRNLQKHMTMMTAEFEKITRENSDLKSHLRQMSEDR